jgi:hypothetical protein
MSEPFEIDPDDLVRGVYVAPLIGVNFVEPWWLP